jgi:hypothetical protein
MGEIVDTYPVKPDGLATSVDEGGRPKLSGLPLPLHRQPLQPLREPDQCIPRIGGGSRRSHFPILPRQLPELLGSQIGERRTE